MSNVKTSIPTNRVRRSESMSLHRVALLVIGAGAISFIPVLEMLSSSSSSSSSISDLTKQEFRRHKKSITYLGNHRTNTGWSFDSICLQDKDHLLIYGVGAGENINWDTGLLDTYGLDRTTVHMFDPTEKSIRYTTPIVQKYNDMTLCVKGDRRCLTHTAEGLSNKPGNLTFVMPTKKNHVSMRQTQFVDGTKLDDRDVVTVPVNTLDAWMKERGHEYLDILKMDIEGAEFAVLEDLLDRKFMPFTQLLVEYHDRMLPRRGSERARANQIRKRLVDPTDGGFVELWSQNRGQEVAYVKIADLAYCDDGQSRRHP